MRTDGRIYVGRQQWRTISATIRASCLASPFEDTQRNCGNLIYKNPTSLHFSRTISTFLFPCRFFHRLHPRWLPTRESKSTNPSPSLAKLPLVTSSLSTMTAMVARKVLLSALSPTPLAVKSWKSNLKQTKFTRHGTLLSPA